MDGEDHFAFVALDNEDPNGIIAVVHYDREPGREGRWQGCGVGIELTHRLIDEARDRGVRYLYGLVMRENRRMLHLFRDLNLHEQERREDGVTRFEVSLRAEQR